VNGALAYTIGQVERLGRVSIGALNGTGRCGVLFWEAMTLAVRPPYRLHLLFKQMEFIGNKSLGVTLLTGLFTGMVMTFQIYRALRDFSSESIVGGLVAVAMVRELGPVLTALMVNARAGSAVAAEIGTMRVTEQIDALFALAVNPVQYLITPRVLAGLIMLPFLGAIADMTGVLGGYLVGVILLGVDSGIYRAKVIDFLSFSDIMQGAVKAAVFGTILTHVGCYKGYFTSGGAEGVGRATTEAVVLSAVLILFSDYLITVFWQS
jgi:phospholipid/cholesterol/gamma-HCH transport system permease protein